MKTEMSSSLIFPAEVELRIFNFLLHNDYKRSAATFLRLSKSHFTTFVSRVCHTIVITETSIQRLPELLLGRDCQPDDYRPWIRRLVFARTCVEKPAFEFLNRMSRIKELLLPDLESVIITRQYYAESRMFEYDFHWDATYYVLHRLVACQLDVSICIDMQLSGDADWVYAFRTRACPVTPGVSWLDADLEQITEHLSMTDPVDCLFHLNKAGMLDKWGMAHLPHKWLPHRVVLRKAPHNHWMWSSLSRLSGHKYADMHRTIEVHLQPLKEDHYLGMCKDWRERFFRQVMTDFSGRLIAAALDSPDYDIRIQNLDTPSDVLVEVAIRTITDRHLMVDAGAASLIRRFTQIDGNAPINCSCDFDRLGGSVDQCSWETISVGAEASVDETGDGFDDQGEEDT